MAEIPSDAAPSACSYSLIIRQLLHTTTTYGPGREIVYRDLVRHDYSTFLERVRRIAAGLARRALDLGIDVFSAYGMSETAPVLTIAQLEGAAEVAAIGVPHEKWGERPLLLIVATDTPNQDLRPESVRAHLRDRASRGQISRWAVPDTVLLVDAIEKTSVGKIDKKALRQKYGSG
jgi:acyl-CoA synthetase (AMP-forming)/AMP-acid ligase II